MNQAFGHHNQYPPGTLAQQLMMHNQAGFDGFSQTDLISQQYPWELSTAYLMCNIELVRQEFDSSAGESPHRRLVDTVAVTERGAEGVRLTVHGGTTPNETYDFGQLILAIQPPDNDALQSLRDAGFDAVTEDALLIRLRDEPGALAKVARRFKEANIDLRSVRFIRRQGGWAFVALATDRTEDAKALVKEYLASS